MIFSLLLCVGCIQSKINFDICWGLVYTTLSRSILQPGIQIKKTKISLAASKPNLMLWEPSGALDFLQYAWLHGNLLGKRATYTYLSWVRDQLKKLRVGSGVWKLWLSRSVTVHQIFQWHTYIYDPLEREGQVNNAVIEISYSFFSQNCSKIIIVKSCTRYHEIQQSTSYEGPKRSSLRLQNLIVELVT